MAAVASTILSPPTGTVTFTLGGTVAGSPPLLDGHATLEVAPSSAAATVTVERAATTIDPTDVAQPADQTAGR